MKYTKDTVDKILNFVRAGNNHRDSANLAGLSEQTFYVWKADKPEFYEALQKAEAECKARMIQVIRKAAFGADGKPPIWTAAAWYLERKYQDEFAQRYRLSHEGKDGGPIRLLNEVRSKLRGMDKDKLRKIAEKE